MKRIFLFLVLVLCFVSIAYTQPVRPVKPFNDSYGIKEGLTTIERMIIDGNVVIDNIFNDINVVEEYATIFHFRFQIPINSDVNRWYFSNMYNRIKVSILLSPFYLYYTKIHNNQFYREVLNKVESNDLSENALTNLFSFWFDFGYTYQINSDGNKRYIDSNRNVLTETQYNDLILLNSSLSYSYMRDFPFGRFRSMILPGAR